MIPKNNIHITAPKAENAFLAAVDCGGGEGWSAEESLDELERLAYTAGVAVVGRLIQKLQIPHPTTYLGKGKLAELVKLKSTSGYDVVIFDDELTPNQQNNLEKNLDVKIIDRVALILDIFARHARTHEGKLQVELAQHQYLLPRLSGQWSHLERLGGGIGTRGPGESQLETDRRLIRTKIGKLKLSLEEVRQHRCIQRENRKRTAVPVVALVGYTNAGKSSLLNSLSEADVLVADKLFATLDPTTRRINLPDMTRALVTDTVGFIHKLPPAVIEAFKATLEELSDADLLVHVVDLTSHNAADEYRVVEKILTDLGLGGKPRLTVLNKIDLLVDDYAEKGDVASIAALAQTAGERSDTLIISARKKWGLATLLETVSRILAETKNRAADPK